MKRIGINYKPLRLALSHRNTVSRLLFLTLFLFSFVGGVTSQTTFTKDITGYGDSEGDWYPDPDKLYFDTEGTGWVMGDRDNVGFYVFRPDVEPTLSWGAEKLLGTKVYENIWQFDPAKVSLYLEDGRQYQIIFVHVRGRSWMEQTYPLVMDTNSLGRIAYCVGTTYEDPVDNSKESVAAFWKEIDASVYGPVIQITSTGNVVGTCYFEGSNGFSILCDFLNDADKIATAREKSEKSDQVIVDNIGMDLGLTKQDVYDAIAHTHTGSDIDWDYNVSTLPGDVVVHFSNDGDIYTIHDAEGWEIFCNFIEGGESFSGKTVELGTNIEVSRCAGSGTDQEHAMNEHPFCGTFDGDGKTLTFNYGSSGTPANEDYIAPFRFVNGATIQHLHVSGDIYTQHTHSAGIVGLAYGTSNITDCRSSVNIHSSINGDGTHGGIMSCSWTSSTTNIEGCLFDGSIQSVGENVTTHSCGGFVGWKNATINVTNSLLAADLSTIGSTDSYTFVRRSATIANSYYTSALGTEQGKQRHSITAGQGFTVALSGTATEYTTSGLTAYKDGNTQKPGLLYNGTIYAGNGDAVSLTLPNITTVPLGYQYDGYTASGGNLSCNDTDGWTLTMPDADVTVTAFHSTGQAVPVAYVDENGETQTAQAIALDGTENVDETSGWIELSGSAYYVGTDITYTDRRINFSGSVTLILGDGATMTVTTMTENNYDFQNCSIFAWNHLTICGQALGTGNLNIINTAYYGNGIDAAGDVIINGCYVTATAIAISDNEDDFGNGIEANGSITINGGNVTATGDTGSGIVTYGSITINGGNITATGDTGSGISAGCGGITINGGTVTAIATGNNSYGLYTFQSGDITINGGNVTATATGNDSYGISAEGELILGWTNATDRIYASNKYEEYEEHVTIAKGKAFIDENGTLHTATNVGSLADVTLSPCLLLANANDNSDVIAQGAILCSGEKQIAVALQGRTLYKDGYWNTLCLPFSVTAAQMTETTHPLYGATIKELDATGTYSGKHTGFDPNEDGGTLYLYFKDATSIEAGKPYIVKWASGDNIVSPVFSGVTVSSTAPTGVTLTDGKYIVEAKNSGLNAVQFIGSYSPVTLTGGDTSNLYLGTGIDDKGTVDTSDDVTCSKLYYPNTDKTLNACRAYFHVEFDEPGQEARRIVLNYGDGAESTGIVEITDPNPSPAGAGSWYSLDGRRLSGKPTTKGVYINNGRKVVIK